ncbi:MAG: TRAP transporter small permease [Clostridiaceae bacterium]|nr:TRAP transporter small permease [Clostridiaceae bacterium]
MKIIRGINRFFTWVCMVLIAALMLLMVAEVLRRALFNRAILGSTEWAQVLLVCNMTAFGAAVLSNRQIKVDILTARLPKKAQVVLDVVMLALCLVTISVLSWQQFNFAIKSYNTGIFYNNINLPQWPFVALFALSYGVAALTILSLIIRKIASMIKGEWEKEWRLEEMDEIFVYGKAGPPRRSESEEEGGSSNGDES